jgi:hypothetical protein
MTDPATSSGNTVSRRAKMLVLVWVGILGFGHMITTWYEGEFWPFSRYTLYTKLYESKPFEEPMLYGVLSDGTEIRLDSTYFPPLDRGRYRRALYKVFEQNRHVTPNPVALEAWLDLYHGKAQQGRHDGPELIGMRLYKERRFVSANAETRLGPPNERELRGQYFVDQVFDIPPDVLRRGRGWDADGRTWIGRQEWDRRFGDAMAPTTRPREDQP